MENWVYNLDLLAQNGVLNYDGAAFVKGTAPRYIGSPIGEPSPFPDNIPDAPLLAQPKNDEFKSNSDKSDHFVKNPSWKKWLFGAFAAGLVIFGAIKCKSVFSWIAEKFKGKNTV